MQNIIKRIPALLLVLLLMMLISLALAEAADTYEITIPNTPVKGIIQLEKQGPVLMGFTEHQDPFGYMVHTPVYSNGWIKGAVFEVRAVEDIIGKDGTLWFKANELADTIVTTEKQTDQSRPLPLGHYYVTEVSAPSGYIFDGARYDVLFEAKDHSTPLITANILSVNEFMPTKINLIKEKEITATMTDDNRMIHTELVNIAGEGFIFGLYNAQAISYSNGFLPSGSLIATAVSDKKGTVSFYGQFPAGEYELRELSGPESWELDSATRAINIPSDALVAENEMVISLNTPILNRLIHNDVRISKTDITGSDYLPHTLIEVRNESGKIVLRDYTDEDGYLPAFPAVPGNYTYHEVLAPEGYELSSAELTFTVTAEGEVEGKTTLADGYTRFSILKMDSNHKPLPGVEFGLFREDGSQQMAAVSDSNGLVTFEKVPYGSYTVQETKALPGYMKNDTKIPVIVDGTFVNPEKPIAVLENDQSEILIKKVDQNGTALRGAEFGLYDGNGKLVMTAVSGTDGLVRFIGVDYGKYTIRELKAPYGYLVNPDMISFTVDEGFTNSDVPIATVVDQQKKIMCIKSDPSGKPIAGVKFILLNADTMDVVETAVSDKDGVFTFHNFDIGNWIIRETAAPEGYSLMEDIHFRVGNDWTQPKPIMCVNIPNHYEFIKTDSEGKPLTGVKFRLEDEEGTELGMYKSDQDGVVSINGLKPGTYIIREIETLEGFTLSGDVIKVKLDKYYVVPEQMKQWINYTTIQTGVHMAVTGIMWAGLALMVISVTMGFIHKRKKQKANLSFH